MSLFDLTWRNVRRNFRLYSIYLFSMIIGVVIQFTFSSLMFNEDILKAIENKEGFQQGITIASVAVFLFIIFFILYANTFFMKQRKKEFGMYLLFGMSERQITLMVFYETLLIGAISLVSGILVGGLLSKFFGMLLMNLMQYDQVITFALPLPAIISTILLFLLLAIIISIQSHISIRRVQLVELFHAKEKMDKPIKSSIFLAISSIILLGLAFVLMNLGGESVVWQDYSTLAMIGIAIGIIGGTYLFFRQFIGWILKRMSSSKNYHVGDKVLWTSSLRFQMKGNTLNLTFISLFSAAIIFFIGFVSVNYAVQFDAVGRNLPNDIAFESLDESTNEQIEKHISESNHSITSHNTIEGIVAKPESDMNIAFDNPENFTETVLLVSEKTFNDMVAHRGDKQEVELQENEVVSLSQGSDFPKRYAIDDQQNFSVMTDALHTFKLVELKDYALLGWASDPVTSMVKKEAVLVISDETYYSLENSNTIRTFEIYDITDAGNAESLSKEIHAIVTANPDVYYSSFADVYSKQIESSALMLFAVAFLAVIAIFALVSVIYFKQLREATEQQELYTILRKIGVGTTKLKNVIRKQLLFVFFPPLVLGLLISWFILENYILDSVRDFPHLTSIILGTIAVYFVIYVLLYLSSTNIYYKIANQRL
ncbi:FtsX-like permease family protein [Ornithinibacillus sp. 179-J 7C1 HS]|uniref:FtsX-like permease family protein n=1 Tax=Ornithinibacillus sp. 179-J 7C1 HS TaxID=3142384 RepID=UPI0039A27BF8